MSRDCNSGMLSHLSQRPAPVGTGTLSHGRAGASEEGGEYMSLRALVTGGAGFIGSHLVDALLAAGQQVHVLDDLSTGDLDNLSSVPTDRRHRVTIASIMNETVVNAAVADADIVIHLAAAVGVRRILDRPLASLLTNLHGTETVLAAGDRYRRPVVLASTSEVYGKNTDHPLREDANRVLGSSTRARWHYAAAKAAAEDLAFAYQEERGVRVMVLRLFNVVGPRQSAHYGMVIPRFVRQALCNAPITVYGDGEQTRCFTFIGDVVRSIAALLDCPDAWGRIINIGSQEETRINTLAEQIVTQTRSRSMILHIPYAEAFPHGFEDMVRRCPDVSTLAGLIGSTPQTPLATSLRHVIAAARGEAPLDPSVG